MFVFHGYTNTIQFFDMSMFFTLSRTHFSSTCPNGILPKETAGDALRATRWCLEGLIDCVGSGPSASVVHSTKTDVTTCHANADRVPRDHINQSRHHDGEEHRGERLVDEQELDKTADENQHR